MLGGNGFIGSEVCDHLLSNYADCSLVLVNRGHWKEWDSGDRVRSRVTESLVWDRQTDSISECLHKYLNIEGFVFEAVLDFSAYRKRDVNRVINQLKAHQFKVRIYDKNFGHNIF